MKKIILTLLALVGTMSMNAQVIEVMKNGQDTPVETYNGSDYYVVFKEAPVPSGQGEAEATGIGKVKWVQLWENGPKFAEYNVGATSVEDYGGYYNWGKTTNKDTSGDYNSGTDALAGTDDTATNLWGSKWRMPTKEEFDNLLAKCDVKWIDGSTEKYNNTTVTGLLCTGKEGTAYENNLVFLPAAGDCYDGNVRAQGYYGNYWSSTPSGSSRAYFLGFSSGDQDVDYNYRGLGFSVRAVLAEE